jgi:RNA polymerase sigma-70 factor (ECF subfamily)
VILKICANADDAAELSQETFVKVIENIDKFEGRSSFYTWLFRIAVNLTLSYCKRSVKLGLKSLDAEDDERNWQGRRVLKDFLSADGSSDPAAIAANKELCELIKKAMMQLDDKQRAVIVLRDIEGMDYAQIAKVLDVELGTVKSRLSRGRSNLREIMEAIS